MKKLTLDKLNAAQPGDRKVIPMAVLVAEKRDGESLEDTVARLFPNIVPTHSPYQTTFNVLLTDAGSARWGFLHPDLITEILTASHGSDE